MAADGQGAANNTESNLGLSDLPKDTTTCGQLEPGPFNLSIISTWPNSPTAPQLPNMPSNVHFV